MHAYYIFAVKQMLCPHIYILPSIYIDVCILYYTFVWLTTLRLQYAKPHEICKSRKQYMYIYVCMCVCIYYSLEVNPVAPTLIPLFHGPAPLTAYIYILH